jgi:Family of unknown function (DUF6455)
MGRVARNMGDFGCYFWLTRSVARVIGADLSEALAARRLSSGQYSAMIDRCRISGCHSDCEYWLATHSGHADTAPGFCPNADILNRLRRFSH